MKPQADHKLNELLHQYVFITDPAHKVAPNHNYLVGRESFDPIMAELARHRWTVITTIKEDRSVVVRLKHPTVHLSREVVLSQYHDHAHIRALAILALLASGLKIGAIERATGEVFDA